MTRTVYTTPPQLARYADLFRDAWNKANDEGRDGERVTDGLTAVFSRMASERTLVLTGPENLVNHIEGIQATLTKRNARIAELEEALRLAVDGEPSQEALKKAYRRGWKACASSAMTGVSAAARALQEAQRMAYSAYDEGERVEAVESPEVLVP